MLPDRVSNPGPLTYESGALPMHKVISECTVIKIREVGMWQETAINGYPKSDNIK